MSMNNKQRWMGGVVLLGGGVLLAALLLKGNQEIEQAQQKIQAPVPETEQAPKMAQPAQDSEMVSLQALAVDVETEKRLLEEQRRSREKAVAEQEARAAEFLKMQQQAEAAAARKAAEEYAAINAHRAQQDSSDNIPPELVEDETAKQRLAEEKHKLAQKQQAEAEKKAEADKQLAADKRKAEAEKKATEEKRKAEAEKKAAEEKRKAEAEKKAAADKRKAEAEKKAAEEKRKVEAENKVAEEKRKAEAEKKRKADAEKARELMENGDKKWMVQVALAANQANADAVVSKLRAKGYKVTTSQTTKGIRIMVGPAKDRDVADAARKKISSDESLNMKGAWVIDWVPLEQR
ncbi:MAG: SPOR domain-containing protein [Acinetobacter sp.]|nr:SPOR domain-containing protein [Acinetobacter sp.]